MKKTTADWLAGAIVGLVVMTLVILVIGWVTRDVPHEWHAAVILTIYYLSQIASHLSSVKKAADVIKEN